MENSTDPCRTLNVAFTYKASFTSYKLLSDAEHHLNSNVDLVFFNLSNISFIGKNSTIVCTAEEVGFAFIQVRNASFDGITFKYCSAERNSTSRFYKSTNPNAFILYSFKVGVYFYSCTTVSMSDVIVTSSPGATGMVMYDVNGTVTIDSCTFSNNSVVGKEIGGGGLYVEFTYCIPGDQNCKDGLQYSNITNALFSISNTKFLNNIADNQDGFSNATFIVPYQSNHQAFGRGGGLSIFMNGLASSNKILVTDCLFENNTAQWGGGGFIEFHDEVDNNQIVFTNCIFIENKCIYTLVSGTGGGGMRIGHYIYGFNENTNNKKGNKIELRSCNFTLNSAMYGGGLSVSPTLRNTGAKEFLPAVLNLTDVLFQSNIGKNGAALHLEKFALLTEGKMILVVLQGCVFMTNRVTYAKFLGEHNSPHPVGIGAVYINQVFTAFLKINKFIENDGTALAVIGTYVNFSDSNILFERNKGYRGGALSLLGAAYLIINNYTQMIFWSNLAHDFGGAIYNRYVEMDNLKTRTNCFIRHVNPFLGPNNWNATFKFVNNTDQNGKHINSIHTSSILPCFWAGGDGYSVSEDVIFCWQNWNHCENNNSEFQCAYDENSGCRYHISSDPGNISNSSNITAFPGWNFDLHLDITDDYSNDVEQSVVFKTTQRDGNNKVDSYIWNNAGTVKGLENASSSLSLEIVGDRVWEVNVMVQLLPCPPGFQFSNDTCVCGNDTQSYYSGNVHCIFDSQQAHLRERHWMGKIGSKDYLVGSCPNGFCQTSDTSYIDLPKDHNSLPGAVCSNNRTGVLCGECMNGSGPAINSPTFDCIDCTNITQSTNVIKYVFLVYLPLTVFFIVLIVFDIRLTTGPANAFIIFCQVVTSTLDLEADGAIPLHTDVRGIKTLKDIYLFIYGIFNLEFFENLVTDICVSPSFNALTALALDYGVAVFPLIIIIFIMVCVKLKSLCICRSSAKASQVARTLCKWRTKPIMESFLPAFAAFILLSYTKFSLTSSYILEKQNLLAEDGSYTDARVYYAGQLDVHDSTYITYYYIPSVVVFALVCIIPIMLLVYPLKILEWCLFKVSFLWKFYPVDKVHFFLDTFQGCYRNNMRFFAGLYFLFRLTINGAYLATSSWPMQFIIQQMACIIMVALVSLCQPYNRENNLFNYVDNLIFTNILILNSLTFYLYVSSSSGNEHPSLSVFVIQYILILLPLVYMIGYILWFLLQRNQCVRKKGRRLLSKFRYFKHLPRNSNSINTTERATLVNNDDEFFERARVTNQYKRAGSIEREVPEVSINSQEHLEALSSMQTAEMTRASETKSSANSAYGTYGTTSSEKSSTS